MAITITYNTEITELIKAQEIINEIESMHTKILAKINPRIDELDTGMSSGILNSDYKNEGGGSLYYDMASPIKSAYETLKTNVTAVCETAYSNAVVKRDEELSKLKTKVEERIEELEGEINQYKAAYNSAYNSATNDSVKSSVKNSYYGDNGSITIRDNELTNLKSKLEDIENEISGPLAALLSSYVAAKYDSRGFKLNPGYTNTDLEGHGDYRSSQDSNSPSSTTPETSDDNNDAKNETQNDNNGNNETKLASNAKDEGTAGTNIKIDEINSKWKCSIVGYTSDGRAVYFDDMSSGKCYVKDEQGNYVEVGKGYKDGYNVYTIDGKEWILSKTYDNCNTSAFEYNSIPKQYDTGDKFNYHNDDYKVVGYTPDGVKIYADNDLYKDYYTYDESTGNLVKLEPENVVNSDGYVVDVYYMINGKKCDIKHDLLDENPNSNN